MRAVLRLHSTIYRMMAMLAEVLFQWQYRNDTECH